MIIIPFPTLDENVNVNQIGRNVISHVSFLVCARPACFCQSPWEQWSDLTSPVNGRYSVICISKQTALKVSLYLRVETNANYVDQAFFSGEVTINLIAPIKRFHV